MSDPGLIDAINGNTAGIVGAGAAAIIGAVLAFSKVMRTWQNDRTESYSDTTTNKLMERLVSEIDRLTLQNTTLSNLVHSMQLEIIKLREENAEIKLLFVKETHGKVDPPPAK